MATESGGQNLSEEYVDVKCTICAKKNRVKQALKYCIDCKKNLCNDCVEIHTQHIEGHTLVEGHGDDQEVNLLTEKCEKHRDKLIELFCVDHDELVCSICALLEHRKCDGIKHITDSIEDLNKDQKVDNVTEQLKTTLQNVDHVITALDQHTEEMSQREHKFLEEIEEYTKRLLAKIETLQRNARKEVSTKHEQTASEATQKRKVCLTAKTDIMKCMDDMMSAGNRKAHLFILKKKGQSMTKNVETLCKVSENMMKTVQFMFKVDLRVEGTLDEFISLVTEREKYKVSVKVNIDASLKDDPDSCDIEGCCLLPDGTVLLVDDNNKRVKHVDTSNCTIKDHCQLTDNLRGITRISPRDVAVCTGGTSVQIVSVGNKMTCTSTIQLDYESTIQLDYESTRIVHSNGELFISNGNCVHVHDLTGTLLRTIRNDDSGENMFSNIHGIVLNQTEDRVYVADLNMGLICTDRAGQEVFRLSEAELGLSGAHGLCTDQRGNVLVCGYCSNNVVQVTEDGQVIGEILSEDDEVEHPQCLCYDADRCRLYVGGATSHLLMYQLF